MPALTPADWLARDIAPQAHALDRSPDALRGALDRAAEAEMLGLTAPTAVGGRALDPLGFAGAQLAASRASGTWAFVQTQHQGAVGFAARAQGEGRRWLEPLARGRVRCGIAYAFLRRPGPPAVVATPQGDGLRLRGHAPWMTGWDLFSHCVTAGRRPDGRIAFALHPLDHPGVSASPPMRLAAFEAAQTVSLDLDLEIPAEDVLFTVSADWLTERDRGSAARQAAFALGTAAAGLDQAAAAVAAGRCDADAAVASLQHSLQQATAAVMDCIERADATPRGLAARARAIELAGRCSHAGVAAWVGAANRADHPAQRVFREALGFTVLAQTRDVQRATLAALARLDPPAPRDSRAP
jgi:alkylation response protein AidB-like acyl-CoA dehydrogenase